MIKIMKGDIFSSPGTIVIPVNCVGVMGKGLAKQVKDKWPSVYEDYKKKCNKLAPGSACLLSTGRCLPGGAYFYGRFLFLATKDHWRNPSELKWIIEGLKNISSMLDRIEKSGGGPPEYIAPPLAIPKIGCGNGGLDWLIVKPLIFAILGILNTEIHIYE